MSLKRYPGNARMSAAVAHGNTLYLKGVTPSSTEKGVEEQTRDVLAQVEALLEQGGASKENVVKVMIWLSDISDFDAMNSIYDSWISKGNEPVRACVEAKLANPAIRVEIQVEASIGQLAQ